MNNNEVKSGNISLRLKENPLNVEGLFYLPKSTNVCPFGNMSFLIRTPDSVSEPVLLTEVLNYIPNGDQLTFTLSDRSSEFFADFNISSDSRGIRIICKVDAVKPFWLLEWKISGLKLDEILIPALGGQSLNSNMPEGTLLSYKYPFWWNAQFVLGMIGNEGLIFRSEQTDPDLKLLRVFKEKESFELTYGFEVPAPLDKKTYTAEIFINSFEDGWKQGVNIHRKWMEETFNLSPLESINDLPEWIYDINFILEIWGARRDKTEPAHSFREMRQRIRDFAELHNPSNTLLYLPGFAENGIDSNAPDYNPSVQCGGEENFKLLVDEAHQLGYRVMIHTNVLAMTFHHRLYQEFKKFQVIDCFGRAQTWGLDMDGDWLTEPYFAYINPAYTQWGDLMEKTLGNLIGRFRLDAVFLDQTLLAFNTADGENFVNGMRKHIERLKTAFPNVLFAGEGLHEQNVSALPFAQIHGLDSIAEVHGMDGRYSWREAHPLSAYLFGKYTKLAAHLLTKHPSHPMFKLQENSYSRLGVIPALVLYNSAQPIKSEDTANMIKRASALTSFKDLK